MWAEACRGCWGTHGGPEQLPLGNLKWGVRRYRLASSPQLCPHHGVSSPEPISQDQAPFHFLFRPLATSSVPDSDQRLRELTHTQAGRASQSLEHFASFTNTVTQEGTRLQSGSAECDLVCVMPELWGPCDTDMRS